MWYALLMSLFRTAAVLLPCAAVLILFLSACRVGYPFRGPGYDSERGVIHPASGRLVFVAITQGDVGSGKSRTFSENLEAVLSTMDEHDGLIGFAVRKELVGARVWTMSAWVDRASMERFAQSPEHRRAVAEGGVARSSFVSAYVDVESEQVPLSWAEAERLLAAAEGSGVSSDE